MDAEQRRKLVWYAAAFLVVAGLAACGWRYGRPAYRHYKATHALTLAREFIQKGDYRSGALSLQQALQANPRNVEAMRLMAELAGNSQSPAALEWWKRVVELEPSLENRLRFALTALQMEKPPFPIASQTLGELGVSAETNVSFHLVASQLALRQGNISNAETHLQAAVRLDPTNRQHQLNLSTVHLRSKDSTVVNTARKQLADLAADPVLGPPALRSLIADSLQAGNLPQAEDYSRRLLGLKQATFEDRLQHAGILQKEKSPEMHGNVERLMQASATNALQAAQLANWLSANDQASEALKWIGSLSPGVRTTQPMPLMEAQSLLSLKDWAGLETRLTEQKWEEREFLRLALLARALREQGPGRRELADANWRRAVSAAAAKVGMQVVLLQVAASWGWNEEAESMLWEVARRSPNQSWAWQLLLNARNEAGDTEGLYRVYSAMLERDPNSFPLKNNVACIGLLLDRDVDKSAALAREVYELNKTNASYVSTHAFALHRLGKTTAGLELLEALPGAARLQPDIALYYAVILSASGQKPRAAPFIAAAEQGKMLPEERRLLAAAKAN